MNAASHGRRADTVRHPLPTSGRRATAHGQAHGLAHSDMKVVELLHRSGLPDAETLLDDSTTRREAK
ncbi:hypothetical protein [Streptomyces sp. NPDC004685]